MSGGFNKLINFFLFSCLVLMGVAYFKKDQRPDYTKIKKELYSEPVQNKVVKNPFTIEYEGETYHVTPKYSYDLYGFVASHNNISSITDSYHDDRSVDLKDICVLWGSNLKNNNFHDVKVSNGSWTCTFRYPGGFDFDVFSGSNNHLLSGDPEVQEKIKSIRKNDQVHITGYLVDYYPESNPNFIRNTSITRKDLSNRSCEVIYVESIEILQRENEDWYFIFDGLMYVLGVLIFLKIILFFIEGQSYRKNTERKIYNFSRFQ